MRYSDANHHLFRFHELVQLNAACIRKLTLSTWQIFAVASINAGLEATQSTTYIPFILKSTNVIPYMVEINRRWTAHEKSKISFLFGVFLS